MGLPVENAIVDTRSGQLAGQSAGGALLQMCRCLARSSPAPLTVEFVLLTGGEALFS
jgi:hypothetical protein